MSKITNNEVVYNFIHNEDYGNAAQNMSYIDRLDLRVLYSYSTAVAVYIKKHDKYLISSGRYSNTTSKQLSILKRKLDYTYITVHDVNLDLETNLKIALDDLQIEREKLPRKRTDETRRRQYEYIESLCANIAALKAVM